MAEHRTVDAAVEGSSPFIRPKDPFNTGLFLFKITSCFVTSFTLLTNQDPLLESR